MLKICKFYKIKKCNQQMKSKSGENNINNLKNNLLENNLQRNLHIKKNLYIIT